jgi:polyvinyl alcohol dehydrogenase (cytochrome)
MESVVTRRRKRRAAAAAAAALVLLAGACSSDDDAAPTEADSSATTTEPGGTVEVDSGGAEWTQYSHDLANSGLNPDESTVTAESVGSLTERWSIDDVVGVTSTPTVVDGVAYFGDWIGNVHAVDAATGEEIWTTTVGGSVIGSIAVGEGGLFASSGVRVFRLNTETGEVEWEATVNDHAFAMISASPVVADGLVFQGVASGEVTVPKEEYTFRGSIGAYDAATGEEVWRFYTTPGDETGGAGVGIWSTPAVDVDRGVLYVGTGNNYAEPAGDFADSIVAIDYRTGERAWSTQFTFPDVWSAGNPRDKDADVGAGPNLWSVGDQDLVGAADKAGVYHALDRDSGEVVWETELEPGSVFGGVQAAAALVDGTIVVACNIGNPENNSPTNAATVFALDATDGEILWETPVADSMVFAPISAVPGVAFVATTEGTMLALDAASGEELWRYEAPNQIGGAPAIYDGTVLWGYGYALFDGPGEGGLISFNADGD